jgi:hypothetical protein
MKFTLHTSRAWREIRQMHSFTGILLPSIGGSRSFVICECFAFHDGLTDHVRTQVRILLDLSRKRSTRASFSASAKTILMTLAIADDAMILELGYRMQHSKRKYRHVSWIPQIAIGAANIWAIHGNVQPSKQLFVSEICSGVQRNHARSPATAGHTAL